MADLKKNLEGKLNFMHNVPVPVMPKEKEIIKEDKQKHEI